MKSKRYTRSDLHEDIKAINETLAGSGYYIFAQGRNGYTGLDEYKGDPNQRDSGKCIRNLQCGTPRECLQAALSYEPPVH